MESNSRLFRKFSFGLAFGLFILMLGAGTRVSLAHELAFLQRAIIFVLLIGAARFLRYHIEKKNLLDGIAMPAGMLAVILLELAKLLSQIASAPG